MRRLAIAGPLLALAIAGPAASQPQPSGQPDFAHAKELYSSATAAMNEGRYADAARDFGGAYDITHDPVLFFKIAEANRQAGHCDVAIIYYGRYLREANPEPTYIELTHEKIKACGGEPDTSAAGSAAGSAALPAEPEPPAAGSAAEAPAEPAGSAALPPPSAGSAATSTPPATGIDHGDDRAWLLVGGGLAFVTAGAVLAYSASSSEQDLRDLYVSSGNNPPTYDARTAQRYHDLIDEGKRYQYLSWASFGIAGACAIGATVLFVRSHGDHDEKRVSVTPVVSPHHTGVSATIRF